MWETLDIQFIVPCRPYPLYGHADELEDEGFDAAGFLQSEGFRVQPAHPKPLFLHTVASTEIKSDMAKS